MLNVIYMGCGVVNHRAPLLFVHGARHEAWCWDEHFLDFFTDKGYRAWRLIYAATGTLLGRDTATELSPRNPLRQSLRAQTWIKRLEGVKTSPAGQLSDNDGITVAAQSMFIHPRIEQTAAMPRPVSHGTRQN